jgi:hypothetical protein
LRALALLAVACAGCFDFDNLARLYQPDMGGIPGLEDLAGADLTGYDLPPQPATWKIEPINSSSIRLESVWGSGPDDVYAVGESGAIYHRKSGTWSFVSTGSSSTFYGVWGSSASDVYVVSSGGEIWHSPGDDSWTKLALTLPAAYGIWGSGPDDIYVACVGGVVMKKTAVGWTSKQTPTSSTLKTVWGNTAGDRWAGGNSGTLMHAAPGGEFAPESATPDNINALWGAGGEVFIASEGGAVLKRSTAGVWSTLITHNHALDGLWGSSVANIHAVGFASHLKGNSTAMADDPIPNAPTGFLVAVWGSSARDVYVVGGRGTILHFTN